MSGSNEQLERLISRRLDREASARELRELESALQSDPAARALFDRARALDDAAGEALRWAMRRRTPRPRPVWRLAARYAAVSAAACLALVAWPTNRPRPQRDGDASAAAAAQAASWFVPAPAWGDSFRPEASAAPTPRWQLESTQRDWIVVPGVRSGEYLIVEVKRAKTRSLPIEQDF